MARLASVPDLDRELDRLYGGPPETFVAERDALAARLRQAHQPEAAATVAALKKPVAVVWAANRLARSEPEAVAALVAAAERLREAQRQALGGAGGRAEVEAAQVAERDAVRELVTAARTRLDPPVSGTALDRLGRALRAAAADPSAQPLLERGRLSGEVRPAGFEAVDGLAVRRPGKRRTEDAARARVEALRAEARRLAAEARAAERAASGAERHASKLRAVADDAHAAAERAQRAAEAARSRLQERS
ncbi:MAG TPA: hypothetical protein VF094_08160 [Gaiellaceae bacterium]